jgi:hypothetical protein
MALPKAASENPPATRTAAAAIASSVEILQSHLEFVLDERVGALNADQRRFLDVAARGGGLGASFWVWQLMDDEQWSALSSFPWAARG